MRQGQANLAHDVLLLGSIALESAEAVMAAVADKLGDAVRRIPDGETGPRSKFITWQVPVLAQSGQFDMLPLGPQSEWGPNGEFPPRVMKLKPGAEDRLKFPPTGYAEAALESYRVFSRLKSAGRIGGDVRFQVGLPTPLGVLAVFMEPDGQRASEPAYRQRLLEDVDRIAAGIPHRELSVQFDVPEEIAVWEGHNTTCLERPREQIVEKLVELMDRVPKDAELGMHLCYGDISHKHWKVPDVGVMAAFTNAVVAKLGRRLDYIHMPVPRHWTDPGRFAKLEDFRLARETKVYLGLVHMSDGVDGARKRIDAARQHLAEFGVAASCGLGRRDPRDIPRILALHREVAAIA